MSNASTISNASAARNAKPTLTLSVSGEPVLKAFEANTFYKRLRGLHAFWPLGADEALIINPCNAIHTLTMPTAIDVLFVNAAGVVLSTQTVPRFRFRRCVGAAAVVEMSAGTLQRLSIGVGDVVKQTREEVL